MNKQIRVLVVEDSEDDALLLIMELKRGGYEPEYERVDTPDAMSASLDSRKWDIVISDYMMPRFGGLEALKLLRKKEIDIPFIIVSGKIGEDIAVDAMKAGAQDYITKGNMARLIPAIERELIEAKDRIKRKLAEEALKKSEKSLKKAQELGKIGNWEFDLKTQKIYWSDEVYVLYERDKSLGPPSAREEAQYYPPEVAKNLQEFARMAMETGKEYSYDITASLPSGRIALFSTSINPVKDELGKVIQLWGTVQDITERKQAEVEREQFCKFFQISPDLMVIADPNGCFKKVNPACLNVLGYSETELLAKPFIDFVHPDDRQSTLDEMARQIQRGFTLKFENRYLTKDGTIRWLSWRANYNKDEGITYATARNITERKQTEEELKKYREHLEELVKERTAQVSQKNEELERFNKLFVGRELRMIELKKKITDLEKKIAELESEIEDMKKPVESQDNGSAAQ